MRKAFFEDGKVVEFDDYADLQLEMLRQGSKLIRIEAESKWDSQEYLDGWVERLNTKVFSTKTQKYVQDINREFAGRTIQELLHLDDASLVIVFPGGQKLTVKQGGCGCCGSGVDLSY